jgi:hypothetical protein
MSLWIPARGVLDQSPIYNGGGFGLWSAGEFVDIGVGNY